MLVDGDDLVVDDDRFEGVAVSTNLVCLSVKIAELLGNWKLRLLYLREGGVP